MDSDVAWVNAKSGRQSWRYADAFQRSIILEAIYHFTILGQVKKVETDAVLIEPWTFRSSLVLELWWKISIWHLA